MTITKATRWRVFAGVWIQSLFTAAVVLVFAARKLTAAMQSEKA